jgi:hypothetical protein
MTFILLLLLGLILEVRMRFGRSKTVGSHSIKTMRIYTKGSSADVDRQLAAAEREAGEGDLQAAGSPLLSV